MDKSESLQGIEKAAILLNYLGTDCAKKFFHRMSDRDIKRLLVTMGQFKVVPVEVTRQILEEFHGMISESQSYIFSDISRKMVVDVMGEEKARGVLSNVPPSRSILEGLETVDIPSLTAFLINEHPQTISVVLAHLEVGKRGEVLQQLPESLQFEVILRLSHLDHVDPELICELEKVLNQELSLEKRPESFSYGGIQSVADMLNAVSQEAEEAILSQIETRDPQLADEIRKYMFLFEDLVKVDDRGIQILLREVPNHQLLLALKIASQEVKEKILKNISQRASDLLKEDLEDMGSSKLSDVESAQTEIVNIAKRLEQTDQIFIMREGARNVAV